MTARLSPTGTLRTHCSVAPHVSASGQPRRGRSRARPIPTRTWLSSWLSMWLLSLAPTALLASALALTLLVTSLTAQAQGSDPMRPLNTSRSSASAGMTHSGPPAVPAAQAPVTPSALTGLAHDTTTAAARERGLMAILAGPDGRWMAWFEERWVRAGDRISDRSTERADETAAEREGGRADDRVGGRLGGRAGGGLSGRATEHPGTALIAEVGSNELVIVQGRRRTTLQLLPLPLPLPLALAAPAPRAAPAAAPHAPPPPSTALSPLIGSAQTLPPNPQQHAARWRRETP